MSKKSKVFLKTLVERYRNELILAVIWILAILIINPIGDFPLNDDWAYGSNVFHLSQEGKLILSSWPAMTLIAQVLWGALVTFVFGFSFTVLRFSTLIIGLFTILSFYRLFINAGTNKNISLAGAFLFLFSPLFFYSSFTFMTEVYFLFSLNMSFVFFFEFYKNEKVRFLLIGSFFVLVSSLIRQPGIAVGIAFAIIYLLNKQFSVKHLSFALIPTIIGAIGLFSYSFWLHHTGRTNNFSDFNIIIKQLSEAPIDYYLNRLVIISLYLGLFSLPISILFLPRIILKYKWPEKIVMFIFVGLVYFSAVINSFPIGNVVYNLGLGPKLLKDSYWGDNINPMLSGQVMTGIRILSLISAVIVVSVFIKAIIRGWRKIVRAKSSHARFLRATFVIFFLIYLSFVIANPTFFDRYVLPCIPAFFLIIIPLKQLFNKKNKFAFGFLLSIYAIFCIAATHDYLSWNRARWEAVNYLTNEKKVDVHKIDGGFEFNAWFQTGGFNPGIKNKISWWFVSSDDYVVSFGSIEGFETIRKIGYLRLLPPGHDSIYILYQQPIIIPYTAFPIICDCEKINSDNYFLSQNNTVDFVGGAQQSNAESLSGDFSVKLDSINQFGLLCKFPNIQAGERFIFKVWRKASDDKAGIAIATEPDNKLSNFTSQESETNSKGWELIKTEVVIPENCDGSKLSIFLYNPSKNTVWFDDLEIIKLPKGENKTQY